MSTACPGTAEQSMQLVMYDPSFDWETPLNEYMSRLEEGFVELRGAPVRAIVRELVQNGLKAVLKRVYFEKNDNGTLEGFREAISDRVSLARLTALARKRRWNTCVQVRKWKGDLRIVVSNAGKPTKQERLRIDEFLKHALDRRAIRALFEANPLEDHFREAGGMGLEMVVALVQGLGIPKKSFHVYAARNRTYSRVHIPMPQK